MINLWKKKSQLLEAIYAQVEQGLDFDTVVNIEATYIRISDDIGQIIWWFTIIVSRYARFGKTISEYFENNVRVALSNFKSLNLSELEMSEEDKKQFQADAKEVEEYLVWLDKNKLK